MFPEVIRRNRIANDLRFWLPILESLDLVVRTESNGKLLLQAGVEGIDYIMLSDCLNEDKIRYDFHKPQKDVKKKEAAVGKRKAVA